MIKRIWIAAVVCGLALAACAPVSSTQPGEAYPSPSNPTPGGYPPPSGTADPLAGTSWILAQLNGQPALADVSVTLEFAGGRLGGSDGCNSYGGGYQVEGGKLKVDPNMVSTLMACADEIMQQASAYTAVLLQSPAFQVEAGQLTLLGEDGARRHPQVARRIEFCADEMALWYARSDLMAALADLYDEETAQRQVARQSVLFRGLLPKSMMARPGALRN